MDNITVGDNVQGVNLQGNQIKGEVMQIGRIFQIAIVKGNRDRLDAHEANLSDLRKVEE